MGISEISLLPLFSELGILVWRANQLDGKRVKFICIIMFISKTALPKIFIFPFTYNLLHMVELKKIKNKLRNAWISQKRSVISLSYCYINITFTGENTYNGDHSDAHQSTFSHSSKEVSVSTIFLIYTLVLL